MTKKLVVGFVFIKENMIMRILVTGGAGFIGSSVANRLCCIGCDVTVIDNLSPQIHGTDPSVTSALYKSLNEKIRFVFGDVSDRSLMSSLIKEHDAIIHLAAETGTGQSMYEIHKYVDINVNATALILDILTNEVHTIKKFVVASSRSIYGEGKYLDQTGKEVYPSARHEEDLRSGRFELYDSGKQLTLCATDENSKIHPSSVYGITKQVQEQLVLTVCNSIDVSAISLRYQNVYGPGQSLSNPYTGILSIFSTRMLNGNKIEIYEDGLESRDFIFIDDIVDATTKAILSDGSINGAFNVGSGVCTSVIEVVEQLSKNYNVDAEYFISGRYRLGDIRHNFASLDKVSQQLGFYPSVSFQEGVAKFCNWVRGQPLHTDSYEKSVAEMLSRGLMK